MTVADSLFRIAYVALGQAVAESAQNFARWADLASDLLRGVRRSNEVNLLDL